MEKVQCFHLIYIIVIAIALNSRIQFVQHDMFIYIIDKVIPSSSQIFKKIIIYQILQVMNCLVLKYKGLTVISWFRPKTEIL